MEIDWRIQDVDKEDFQGSHWIKTNWFVYSDPKWDHDHCLFCWQKLAGFNYLGNDAQHEGYTNADEIIDQGGVHHRIGWSWICTKCYIDFYEYLEMLEVFE